MPGFALETYMNRAIVLVLVAAGTVLADDAYRPGERTHATRVTGTLAAVHAAEALLPSGADGATARVQGISAKLTVDSVRPPLHLFRRGAGWIEFDSPNDVVHGKTLELLWASASTPTLQALLADGAAVAGTVYYDQSGFVLEVDSAKGHSPDAEDRFDEPYDTLEALLSALRKKDARGVRKQLAAAALARLDAALETAPNDAAGLGDLAAKFVDDDIVVCDELRVEAQPAEAWIRFTHATTGTPARATHLLHDAHGWRVDDVEASDPGAPRLAPAKPVEAALPMDKPALSVIVECASATLEEGDRATATFHVRNTGQGPLLVLAIEPEDAVESIGGDLSPVFPASGVEEDVIAGTIQANRVDGRQKIAGPAPLPRLLRPSILAPGEEQIRQVAFKAPTGHLYAIHFAVTWLAVPKAIEDGAVYLQSGEVKGDGKTTVMFHRAKAGEAVDALSIVNPSEAASAETVHAAIAVEVTPREFSFAKAAQAAGIVPDAATWFAPAKAWAVSKGGKTWIVTATAMTPLGANYVPLLSAVSLSQRKTLELCAPARADEFQRALDERDVDVSEGKGGVATYHVPVRDIFEVLSDADRLGFEVLDGGWKRRE